MRSCTTQWHFEINSVVVQQGKSHQDNHFDPEVKKKAECISRKKHLYWNQYIAEGVFGVAESTEGLSCNLWWEISFLPKCFFFLFFLTKSYYPAFLIAEPLTLKQNSSETTEQHSHGSSSFWGFFFTCRPDSARLFLKRPLIQPGHMLSDNSASVSAFVYSCIFSKQKERFPNNLSEIQP